MKNEEVVERWSKGMASMQTGKALTTDGCNLYSYKLRVGITKNGKKIAIVYSSMTGSFISQTTSKHCGLAALESDYELNPGIHLFKNTEGLHKDIETYESKDTRERIEWIRSIMHDTRVIPTNEAMHLVSFIKVLETDPVVLQYFVDHARERFQEKDKGLIKKFGFLVDILRE